MQPRTLVILSMLLDLKGVATDLLRRKHKNPGLLNLYMFIDICASLANQNKKNTNKDIFENYLEAFSTRSRWDNYSRHELWAARSSLIHSYSPIGHHTEKYENVRPIFYYSWPTNPSDMQMILEHKGYSNFLLIDVIEIQSIVNDTFNNFYSKIENDTDFEMLFLKNSSDILPTSFYIGLEAELSIIEKFSDKNT